MNFSFPRLERERSLYGTNFEIQLRNKLTQRAIARECAKRIRVEQQFNRRVELNQELNACKKEQTSLRLS